MYEKFDLYFSMVDKSFFMITLFLVQFFTHAADNLTWEMTQLKQRKIIKFSMREMKYENFFSTSSQRLEALNSTTKWKFLKFTKFFLHVASLSETRVFFTLFSFLVLTFDLRRAWREDYQLEFHILTRNAQYSEHNTEQ